MFRQIAKEEYKFPASLDYLGEMREFITRVGRKYGVSEHIINNFKLAIDEAATNVIRHAYRDWEGFITIRMLIRDRNVAVSLIDQGRTFDPRKVRDPDLNRYVNIGKKGGLGIFIMRRLIDEIDYRKTVEGNELKLVKFRKAPTRKSSFLPDVSMSIKARFSLTASAILTIFILSGFFFSYLQQKGKIVKGDLEVGRGLARLMAQRSLDPLVNEKNTDLVDIAADVYRNHEQMIVEALVLDKANRIQGVHNTELIFEIFQLPANAVRKADDVMQYRLWDKREVYDVIIPIVPKGMSQHIGSVHLQLNKATIDKKINLARQRTVETFGALLLIGYLCVFGLVYLMMSPFKKLVKWIRAAGQGEVREDVEFDSSDEIGEIAQAFNDITEKFRKSQENLAEQERLQKEMQVAQEIQHTLLPSAFPEIEGYEIASYYEAAKEVGGDYFDFVEVDKDTLGIVVADVSGKGVPGSLVMTMIRTALRTEARGNKNAADVLARVNDFVINDMKRGMFVTVFYMVLDSRNRTINYASAGHNPMILYRGRTKKSFYLNPRGFPIGLNLPDRALFRKAIESDTIQLKEGDILICYTDGVTEAMNLERDKFGEERLLSIIRKNAQLKVDPLVDCIRDEIKNFTGGIAQSDDITLVAIREKMRAEDVHFNMRSKLIGLVNENGMNVKEACKKMGVSTSTYYKYKKRFDLKGEDGLRDENREMEIEEKHISIEDKVKLFDIVKNNPDIGAKRLSEELNTEKYGFTVMDEKRVYDELVRSRLNTRELRVAFAERGGKGKRIKPPGTPFLTLDGQIILPSGLKKSFRPMVGTDGSEGEEKPKIEIRASQKPKEEIGREYLAIFDEGKQAADGPKSAESTPEASTVESAESHDAGPSDTHPEETVPQSESTESLEEWFSMIHESIQSGVQSPSEISHETVEKTDEDGEYSIPSSIAGEIFDEELGKIEAFLESETEGSVSTHSLFEIIDDAESEQRSLYSESGESEKSVSSEVVRRVHRRQFLESGNWYYRQGLFAKAVEEFKKAIQADPESSEAYQHLGDAFYKLGQNEKAVEAYENVKKRDPYNIDVLENLGVIFANRGEYKKAVWQWGEVLKKNPERRDIVERIRRMQRFIRQRSV
jgi:serine phosphatase RsbU (regulator of sigma subunit)/anti-sigma regulatory factor (Ser/Thr protein kinase)/transposase